MLRRFLVPVSIAALAAMAITGTAGATTSSPTTAQLRAENARLQRKVLSQRATIQRLQQPNKHLVDHWLPHFTPDQNADIANSAAIFAQGTCGFDTDTDYEWTTYSGTDGYSSFTLAQSPCPS